MLKVVGVVGKRMFVDLFRILLNGFVRILKRKPKENRLLKQRQWPDALAGLFFFTLEITVGLQYPSTGFNSRCQCEKNHPYELLLVSIINCVLY